MFGSFWKRLWLLQEENNQNITNDLETLYGVSP